LAIGAVALLLVATGGTIIHPPPGIGRTCVVKPCLGGMTA
jgi:hypothetical protein